MKWIAKIRNNKYANIIIRVLIVFATYYFLYRELFAGEKLSIVLDVFYSGKESNRNIWLYLIIILLLSPVNWGLETKKWQFLINKIEKISFRKASEAVYSGISVSLFTPNRTGEWFGRIFILEKANHIRSIIVTVLSGMGQLFTTIITGIVATVIFIKLYFIDTYGYSDLFFFSLVSFGLLIIVFSLLIFFNINILPITIHKIFKKSYKKINHYVSVVSEYSHKELLTVLLLSFVRFMTFSLQLYLALRMFSVDIPFFHGLLLIIVFYFVMTVIPTITLAELGIRGLVSIYLFQLYFQTFEPANPPPPEINIVAASYLVWIVNLVIPAIAGTLFVFHLKFIRNTKTGSTVQPAENRT